MFFQGAATRFWHSRPNQKLTENPKNPKKPTKNLEIGKANWKTEQFQKPTKNLKHRKGQLKTWKIPKANWKPEQSKKPIERGGGVQTHNFDHEFQIWGQFLDFLGAQK